MPSFYISADKWSHPYELMKEYTVFHLPKCKSSERHLLSYEKKADGLSKFQLDVAYATSEH